MQKTFILIVLLLVGLINLASAQNTISGKVFDKETKEPLPGVTIFIPHTQTGTSTDNKGKFALTLENTIDTIGISFIGYKTQTIAVTGNSLNIALETSTSMLNEIIVSANREQQRRTETPIAIHSISKLAMLETKATRLDLLLNKTPGVFMVDLGNEQHSMSIRQPLGYRSLFLYLEDGVPIRATGDFNHNALIEINYAALNKIEIIKGPASSLYGSEAVGGAVNFITQSPSFVPTVKVQAEVGSFGYKRSDFFASTTVKKLGLFIGGYYANRDEADSLHNDFHKLALNLRGDYTFSEKTKLITTASFVDYKTDQIGGLDSTHFYNKNYVSFQRFTYRSVNSFRVKSSLQHQWNKKSNISFTLFYRNSTIGQNPFYRIKSVSGNPLKARGEINEDGFQSYGAIVQHSQKIKFLNSKLIVGMSVDFSPATYQSKFISIDKDTSGVYTSYTPSDSTLTKYNVDLLNTAKYLQFEINPIKRLKLVTAIRYDRLGYKFNNHLAPSAFTGAPDETNYFKRFTPKVGLTYDIKKGRGVYLNYSTGFAPPNITELYTGVKVPSLQPASYINYEGGGWFAFGNKGYLDISVYQMDGTNEIVSVKLADGSTENQNAGKTQHKGIEVSIKYNPIEGLAMRVGGTYAEHKYLNYIEKGIDYSGNIMNQAPQYIANSEIIYRPKFIKGFRIAMEWQGMGSYFMDAKNTQKYEGFNVFNARMGYKIKGLEIWLNCINITDAIYATTVEKSSFGTNYRPGQLRTINFGLGYTFSKK